MRKDFKEVVTMAGYNKIIDLACNNNMIVDIYQGCLLDNVIIVNDDIIKIGRKTRKYLIMVEKYLNCWTSNIELIGTDDEQTYNKWVEKFDQLY